MATKNDISKTRLGLPEIDLALIELMNEVERQEMADWPEPSGDIGYDRYTEEDL
jgi:hypothetical protein